MMQGFEPWQEGTICRRSIMTTNVCFQGPSMHGFESGIEVTLVPQYNAYIENHV